MYILEVVEGKVEVKVGEGELEVPGKTPSEGQEQIHDVARHVLDTVIEGEGTLAVYLVGDIK